MTWLAAGVGGSYAVERRVVEHLLLCSTATARVTDGSFLRHLRDMCVRVPPPRRNELLCWCGEVKVGL